MSGRMGQGTNIMDQDTSCTGNHNFKDGVCQNDNCGYSVCEKCDGTGIVFAANGPDDTNKEYCDCPSGNHVRSFDAQFVDPLEALKNLNIGL